MKTILDEVLEKLPEEYNMSDITSKTAERSPYILVCFQECERMNTLIYEIRRSLKELDLGLKVCFKPVVLNWSGCGTHHRPTMTRPDLNQGSFPTSQND